MKTRRNMACIGSELISNVGKMAAYLGIFPTYTQLTTQIMAEIEETATQNRAAHESEALKSPKDPEADPAPKMSEEDEADLTVNELGSDDQGVLKSDPKIYLFQL